MFVMFDQTAIFLKTIISAMKHAVAMLRKNRWQARGSMMCSNSMGSMVSSGRILEKIKSNLD